MTERLSIVDLKRRLREKQSGKARAPRRELERPVHLAVLRYLELVLPGAVIHHSPNELDLGGDRNSKARAQARAKELGMRPGWPDIEVLWHGQFWTFEVKSPDGKPTRAQEECGAEIEAAGGRWAVVRSVDDARRCVEEWSRELRAGGTPVELRGIIS
jgi:hypothetical protein